VLPRRLAVLVEVPGGLQTTPLLEEEVSRMDVHVDLGIEIGPAVEAEHQIAG
jgi:hypothetical protein